MTDKPVITNELQAGGHGGKKSFLFEGEKCYKPTFAPREAQWYHDLVDGKLPAELVTNKIVPKCYGFEKRTDPTDGEETEYIVIENLLWNFKQYE